MTAETRQLLQAARDLQNASRPAQAMSAFSATMALADRANDAASAAEAARRLAVLNHEHGDRLEARRLCIRSHEIARAAGLDGLAAEALNTLGVLQMLGGEPVAARASFERAIDGSARCAEARARAEQNLGILANIRGDLAAALAHYGRSLDAYREMRDQHGCALSFHNLGMVSADRGEARAAEEHFHASLEIATRIEDQTLRALCLVNLAEIDVGRQHFESALEQAEEALRIFERLGSRRGQADSTRVLGIIFRETGRPGPAEARLRAAIELAIEADAALIEAEACRDFALLHQSEGRNQDALRLLDRAGRLFRRLDARTDAVHVGGRIAELESTYLSVVRGWGASIESIDGRTFGHCERVARNAVAMARALNLDAHTETTLLVAAYLHDVGMVRVPRSILVADRPLAPEERAILEMHPIWGLELLASIDFPWDLKPIVHWHHERCDGSGYPDARRGADIPVTAQIVGILDAYDELRCGRFGAAPLAPADAAAQILAQSGQWSTAVVEAFRRTIATTAAAGAAGRSRLDDGSEARAP